MTKGLSFDLVSLKQIIDAFDAGVMLADTSGSLLVSNALAVHLVGLEVSGAAPPHMERWGPDHGFFFPDQITRMPLEEMPMSRALRGESVDEMTMFLRNPNVPDGIFVDVTARPLRDSSGRLWGGVALFHDVSDRYTAAAALAHAFDAGHLEATSTVLHNVGNALNNAATGIESLRERVRARRSLKRLSAVADALEAHREDWVGYLRDDPQGRQAIPFLLALNEEWKAEYTEFERILERTAGRVEHIAGILRAQQSAGLPSTQRKIVPLKKAVWDGVRLLESSLQRRGIAIRVDCTRAPHEIDIHESRFHQMLVNLLRNGMEAIKEWSAEEPGHRPAVSITGYVEDGHLFLDVADNGVGIDAENLGEVFSPGYTTKEGGSGLGLHSVANYVIDSGGGIEALSEGRGLGATIRVHWPLELRVPKLGDA